jgi:hypothetical protein
MISAVLIVGLDLAALTLGLPLPPISGLPEMDIVIVEVG